MRVTRLTGLALLVMLAGCDSDLATGYKPRRLNNTSENDRRSFYAPAFSADSDPGKDAPAPDVGQHVPGR